MNKKFHKLVRKLLSLESIDQWHCFLIHDIINTPSVPIYKTYLGQQKLMYLIQFLDQIYQLLLNQIDIINRDGESTRKKQPDLSRPCNRRPKNNHKFTTIPSL